MREAMTEFYKGKYLAMTFEHFCRFIDGVKPPSKNKTIKKMRNHYFCQSHQMKLNTIHLSLSLKYEQRDEQSLLSVKLRILKTESIEGEFYLSMPRAFAAIY